MFEHMHTLYICDRLLNLKGKGQQQHRSVSMYNKYAYNPIRTLIKTN